MTSGPFVVSAALAIAISACSTTPTPGTGGEDSDATDITLSATSLDFDALGVSEQVIATVRDIAGEVLTTVEVTWSDKVSGIASVNAAGLVTASSNGVDTIVARVGDVSASLIVRVEQLAVSLDLEGPVGFGQLGATAQVQGGPLDRNQQPISGADVTWTSSDPYVAVVDDNGNVTATGAGSAIVSAVSGSFSAQTLVQVLISGPVGGAVVGGAIACSSGSAGPFPCDGIDLVSYLPIGALGGGAGIDINDLWGWTDPQDGGEYVIVGRRDGMAFVDLSDPEKPRYLGFLPRTPGAAANVWHDVKVYNDHAFIVADGAGPHGMQVFDLRQLRNSPPIPQNFTANVVYNSIRSAHNIVINEATGFAYITGASSGGNTCGGGLHMVDINNPLNPTFAGCFAHAQTGRAGTGYTHDAQCVIYSGPDSDHTGSEVCFNSNETHLSIADVTNKANPTAIAKVSYPQVAYTHQGWLSEDQQYLFVNDELDDGATATTRTLVWDVIDLDDPILVNQYLGPTGATDHNNYVRDNLLYASNYQFGVRVLDVSSPTNITQLGFFDTAPQMPNSSGFGGAWSNYPYFSSGILVVTSGDEGLFVLRVQ